MERVKLLEEITFSVRRLSGHTEDFVNEVMFTCHKYKMVNLEGSKIVKGQDTNSREDLTRSRGVRIFSAVFSKLVCVVGSSGFLKFLRFEVLVIVV